MCSKALPLGTLEFQQIFNNEPLISFFSEWLLLSHQGIRESWEVRNQGEEEWKKGKSWAQLLWRKAKLDCGLH